MTYRRARSIVLLAGLIVIGLVTLTMILRGVDPVEVTATLFYAPLLAGMLFFGLSGGLWLGVAAAAAYLALRIPAIRLVGFPALAGLVISRVAGFLVFGALGGWAADRLRAMADKLVLYDEVDDDTGLGNARSVVNAVSAERGRAERYGSGFSVVVGTVDASGWRPLGSGARRRQLRRLGERLAASVRDSDHIARVQDGDRELVVLVLPETGAEGAGTVATNLEHRLAELTDSPATTETATYPDDGDAVDRLTARVRVLDERSRP